MDWLDARNTQTGKRLNLRPSRKLSVNWELPVADWTVRNEWVLKSSRFDDAANTKNLPGYGVWNLAAKKDLMDGWSVQMRLENLLDKSYQEIKDVATPGRQWFMGLVWTGH
jgi:vitamin B12 transporter